MRVTIHDVGHGLCVSLVHDNGNVMLWDCGSDDWGRPSEFLREQKIQRIDRFFVTNYDEDHISDLPNLRAKLKISLLRRNKSISPDQLKRLKRQSGRISPAMESMLNMMQEYADGPPINLPQFPGVDFSTFCNTFGTDFKDTNNISLVTFLECKTLRLVIPGDLEEAGWKRLLKNNEFRKQLRKVNVFLASHHGRENGYCAEVFEICKPVVVIFSDSSIKHSTQEMASTYANHASGITYRGKKRYTLSTRNDGPICWNIEIG